MSRLYSSHDGFTLLETVVATGILVTALAGLAQLLTLSLRSTQTMGAEGAALMAAQDKLERLRALAFTYGPVGEPVTDAGLAVSPDLSLAEDTPGFVDFLDREGRVVGAEGEVRGGRFTRRWRVAPIDHLLPEAFAIEVCVFAYPADGLTPVMAQACLATLRVRQP